MPTGKTDNTDNTDNPKLYTLEEAQLELNRTKCDNQGHSFEILHSAGSPDPPTLLCGRCGKRWNVSP